jgi:hypothetical protein
LVSAIGVLHNASVNEREQRMFEQLEAQRDAALDEVRALRERLRLQRLEADAVRSDIAQLRAEMQRVREEGRFERRRDDLVTAATAGFLRGNPSVRPPPAPAPDEQSRNRFELIELD